MVTSRTALAASAQDALLVALLAAAPLFAALAGAPGPLRLTLNLGPGDGPYVAGFTPLHQVDDKVGTHWTTYDAGIALPLEVPGGPVEMSYRFARVFGETAVVEVSFRGEVVDRFSCRGGVFQERHVGVEVAEPGPIRVAFRADSHERKNLGLKLDWVRFEAPEGAWVFLWGGARWRAALLVALLALLLRHAGWGRPGAALLAAPWAAAATYGLLQDPWLTHRLLTGLPETLAVAGGAGVLLGRSLERRGRVSSTDLRLVGALGMTAFLLRAVITNHPDFYYPDLMTHARLVEAVRAAGLDFFRAPATYLGQQGAWTKPAYGSASGLPYAVGFHLLFVPFPLDYDALLTAMKLVGAVISTLPLVLLWAMARRLGASTLGAALMLVIPTYTSRLTFALLPALTGHAMDMALLLWLSGHADRLGERRILLGGAVLLAVCQLSYVSSVTNLCLFLGVFALLGPWDAPGRWRRHALLVLGMGLAGSALAVLAYYRDFLGGVASIVPRMVGHASTAASRYPVESWLALTYDRTLDFFDHVYPVLTLCGLALLSRRRNGRGLLGAWLVTYLVLLLLRAKVPDVFRYGHETLFATPLVCLASGEAIARLAAGAGRWRIAAGAILLFLAVQGLEGQWLALVEQLGNAL